MADRSPSSGGSPLYLKWIEERFPKPSIPVQFRAGVPPKGKLITGLPDYYACVDRAHEEICVAVNDIVKIQRVVQQLWSF